MKIIYTSFLSRNILCKNIYTMSSFIMSNMLFNGIPPNSHSSSSSLSLLMNRVAKKSVSSWLASVSTMVRLSSLINGSISKNGSNGWFEACCSFFNGFCYKSCFPAIRDDFVIGFRIDSFNSTSKSSIDFPSSSCLEIEELYHSVNFLLRKALAEPLTVRSSG